MEIIDAQIHEVSPPVKVDASLGEAVRLLVGVEICREAMDAVGVDAALLFAPQPYMDAAVARYPDRFAGALTFDYAAEDLEEQVANYRKRPGMLAGRNLVGNAATAELRPEFHAGKFDRLWAAAEKHDLPLFFSTHGNTDVMGTVAERHPNLTMVIDHLGLSQSPVSPPRPDPWDQLPGILSLAKYPNIHVKFSGAPLLSREPYPHRDLWPNLLRIVEAFTPDRLMWGTDFTRMRWIPQTSAQLAPRSQWRFYSDCLNYLRDTDELSASDKEKMLSTTIRRVLRWPKP
jgi:predicted TIM-barrel fold metal-dependent hydrolase